MRAWLERNLPLLIAVSVSLMLLQFVGQHWPSASTLRAVQTAVVGWLRVSFWYVAALVAVLWLLVVATWLHSRSAVPRWLGGIIPMDILDRLSNKQAIAAAEKELDAAPVIDADSLAKALKSKVIGQDRVCEDVAVQIRRRLALVQRNRPVGVFLLAGPPGTGKTYLAKVLAQELDRKLLHLDMTQFGAGRYAASQLFGMTKGYVGSDSYGQLTGGLRDFPAAVVLLDEIEKAHPEVMKGFLTAWNDGFVTEASDGRQVSTTKAIFVLTSNAATDTLAALARDFAHDQDELRKASLHALAESGFAPEVLSRIDRIFVFRRLEGLDVARVCALEIESMIRGYGLEIVGGGIDPRIIVELMQRHRKLGAQGSTRDMVRAIEDSISDSLIAARQGGHAAIELVRGESGVVARAAARD